MPYIDFVSKDDRVSIWYTTNTLHGTAGEFDPKKPTIIMLHPIFLDSSWLFMQMEDPRLNSNYNIIAFDMRCCGKSDCKPSGSHDTWVDAADIAFAHQFLGLPPCHVFAVESLSVNAALRFAALFPEMCLSLTLVNAPPPTELNWVFDIYDELLGLWCHPSELDEYEHALYDLSVYMLGKDCSVDLRDQLIAYWSEMFPPWKRTHVYDNMHLLLNRTPLQKSVLGAIKQPTFIIQADRTEINPIKYAQQLAKELVNVPGGAHVQAVKGSPEYMTLVPTCASVVNRLFYMFLSRQKAQTSHFVCRTPIERRERMKAALKSLSEFVEDPAIATRDPDSALSFSCVTPEVFDSQSAQIEKQRLKENEALSPLGLDGRPLRRYSERVTDHWFQGEPVEVTTKNLSVYTKEDRLKQLDYLITQTEISSTTDLPSTERLSATEPVSSEVARSGRIRRSTLSKHIVEKATVGGSSGGFAPALISNTIHMSRLRLYGS